jgi:hypothetical protein
MRWEASRDVSGALFGTARSRMEMSLTRLSRGRNWLRFSMECRLLCTRQIFLDYITGVCVSRMEYLDKKCIRWFVSYGIECISPIVLHTTWQSRILRYHRRRGQRRNRRVSRSNLFSQHHYHCFCLRHRKSFLVAKLLPRISLVKTPSAKWRDLQHKITVWCKS